MDVTGISISIDVDMSGFIEAMEKLMALILTIEDKFGELEGKMEKVAGSIGGIESAASEASGSMGNLVDLISNLLKVRGGDEEAIIPLLGNIGKAITDLIQAYEGTGDSTKRNALLMAQQKFAAQDSAKGLDALTHSVKKYTKATAAAKTIPFSRGDASSLPRVKPASDTATENYERRKTMGLPDATAVFNTPHIDISKPANTADSDKEFQAELQKKLQEVKEFMGKIKPNIKVKMVMDTAPVKEAQNQYKILNQKVTIVNSSIQKQGEVAKKTTDSIQQAMSVTANSITTAFEDMGKAAAGQKTNVLEDEAKQLGAFAEKMGAKYISMGVALEVASGGASSKGWLEIVGGGLLVAAGSAMKSIKMASGGIVSGSSFVNVGEYAGASHNPEVIAPLDRLRGMMGGQHQTHSFEIQGDKLVSILQRVDNNNSFALGGA